MLLETTLRGALIALLALLGAVLWRDHRAAPAARAGTALVAGLCGEALLALLDAVAPRPLIVALVGVAVGNAVLFWLFARTLFDDAFRPAPRHALLWGAAVLLGIVKCLNSVPSISEPAQALASWLPLAAAAGAVAAAGTSWREDLVEPRRRVRAVIVGGGTLYVLVTLALRQRTHSGHLVGGAAMLEAALLLAVVAVATWELLRVVPTPLLAPQPSPAPAAPPEPQETPDARLAAALQRLMTDERAYRREDLSVARLADLLAVPEYRLRRTINHELGHRNFNAYLNRFRLTDAKAALADPARRALPVLTIALEAGFGSIGPFNRAFKADTGLTPTEFRRRASEGPQGRSTQGESLADS